MNEATLRRNDQTLVLNPFATLTLAPASQKPHWARLVSTNPDYSNLNVIEEVVTFGRREGCTVRLASNVVSNLHCKLWREVLHKDDAAEEEELEEVVYLEDFSTNGTFLGETLIGKGNKVEVPSRSEVSYCVCRRRRED